MNDVAEVRTGHAAVVRDRCGHVGPELERTAGSDGLTFSNSIGLITTLATTQNWGFEFLFLPQNPDATPCCERLEGSGWVEKAGG
jgi:hypothetical protein